MPAKSQAQRGFLNWKFGHGWVKQHDFDNTGKLPAKVEGTGAMDTGSLTNIRERELSRLKRLRRK